MSPVWRTRIGYALLALMVANLAAFLAWTLPRALRERNVVTKVRELRAEVDAERAKLEAARRRVDAIRANELETQRMYRDVLPDRSQLVTALEEIVSIGDKLGLRIQEQTYQSTVLTDAAVERTLVTIPLGGTYAQLARFLDHVERSNSFLSVDQVSLRQGGGREGSAASLDLQISAYFRLSAETPRTRTAPTRRLRTR